MKSELWSGPIRQAVLAIGCMAFASCSRPPAADVSGAQPSKYASAVPDGSTEFIIRKMPANKDFSGFLKDYSKLKPNPRLGDNALTFANPDERKNLRKYIAIIVDPVQMYFASDADASRLPAKLRGVAARYFHQSLVDGVSSVYPVVDQPSPLVLRLRAALIGVDVGSPTSGAGKSPDALSHSIDIDKVGVEMELLDADSGEQIGAMVDRERLGSGAAIPSLRFTPEEKWVLASEAFDGWAERVRTFLDLAHELSPDEAKRADQSYHPYSDEPVAAR